MCSKKCTRSFLTLLVGAFLIVPLASGIAFGRSGGDRDEARPAQTVPPKLESVIQGQEYLRDALGDDLEIADIERLEEFGGSERAEKCADSCYSNYYGSYTRYQGQQFSNQCAQLFAVMQSDGNFVLYHNGRATWATGTDGKGGYKAIFQTDGNLVVYNKSGTPLWASNTWGNWYNAKLCLQGDGNMVIYSPYGAIWATGTDGK